MGWRSFWLGWSIGGLAVVAVVLCLRGCPVPAHAAIVAGDTGRWEIVDDTRVGNTDITTYCDAAQNREYTEWVRGDRYAVTRGGKCR